MSKSTKADSLSKREPLKRSKRRNWRSQTLSHSSKREEFLIRKKPNCTAYPELTSKRSNLDGSLTTKKGLNSLKKFPIVKE